MKTGTVNAGGGGGLSRDVGRGGLSRSGLSRSIGHSVGRVVPAMLAAYMALALWGCTSSLEPAPIFEESPQGATQRRSSYEVVSGDTLYSIAWSVGADWRDLARWNQLDDPTLIYPGQKLRLGSEGGASAAAATTQAPAAAPATATAAATTTKAKAKAPPLPKSAGSWVWPLRGTVTRGFKAAGDSSGIDIRGKPGAVVVAAAAGNVVYAGNGLRSYGNLVIIKHSDAFLSAYGHNQVISVREGQQVRQGEQIGVTAGGGSAPGVVHFQIRKDGEPVNPTRYLPAGGT